ncbi:MAG: hypothetical protein GX572_06605 [Clostridia bacterium]|nr:hypothetical protein [Clostridia bacterium]
MMEQDKQKHNKDRLLSRLRHLTDKEKKLFFKLALCLLAGIALMYVARGAGGKDIPESAAVAQDRAAVAGNDYYDEEATLEAKLVTILAQVKGAGAVAVALTFAESVESVYAEEEEQAVSVDQSQSSIALAAINNNPVLIKQRLPKVLGVVIVAEGAGDPLVRERLYQAAASLLGLNAAQIAVIEGNMAP